MKKYFERFKNFDVATWIIVVSMFIMIVVGLQFSIGMSIKMASGLTLFGDSNNADNKLEVKGPTQADLYILSTFWIVTILLMALFIYYMFFKKVRTRDNNIEDEKVNKEIETINKKEDIKLNEDKDDEFLKKLKEKKKDE